MYNILKNFHETDIPDSIIHKINKKYPKTKIMNFLRTEQLDTGMIIIAVSLNLKYISGTCIILEIKSNSSQQFGTLLLLNIYSKIIWNLKPDHYYIFQAEKGTLTSYNFQKNIKNTLNIS